MAKAKLNPVPVREANDCAQCHYSIGRNSPRRAEQQKIQGQQHRRRKMESNINMRRQFKALRHDKSLVDGRDSPIENGNDHLQRRRNNRHGVLELEQRSVER